VWVADPAKVQPRSSESMRGDPLGRLPDHTFQTVLRDEAVQLGILRSQYPEYYRMQRFEMLTISFFLPLRNGYVLTFT